MSQEVELTKENRTNCEVDQGCSFNTMILISAYNAHFIACVVLGVWSRSTDSKHSHVLFCVVEKSFTYELSISLFVLFGNICIRGGIGSNRPRPSGQ